MTFKVIPESATRDGFILGGLGAHSSRTIMLTEMEWLLCAVPASSGIQTYDAAILKDNALLKRTDSTRIESFRRLRELYGLNKHLVLFRVLRDLWEYEPAAQPMLALLCATARDPMLRATATAILSAHLGGVVTPDAISEAVDKQYPGRLNKTTLANIGRHAASSWTQSGHLRGRTHKVRVATQSYPTSVTYALFLGYLCGSRGEALFHMDWARLLDSPLDSLHEHAFLASQQGWLHYRHAGAVTEIVFSYLLRKGGWADE